jgi:hypothetical protein
LRLALAEIAWPLEKEWDKKEKRSLNQGFGCMELMYIDVFGEYPHRTITVK